MKLALFIEFSSKQTKLLEMKPNGNVTQLYFQNLSIYANETYSLRNQRSVKYNRFNI